MNHNIIIAVLVSVIAFTLTISFTEASEASEDLLDIGIQLKNYEQYEGALSYIDRVLEQEPENLRALNAKAEILVNIEQYDAALSILDRILEQEPKNLLALNTKGVTFVNLERDEEALPYFEKILDIEPNNNEKLEKTDEALSYLDKVLEINPDHVEALNIKIAILEKLEKTEEALSYIDKILEINPDHVEALNLKGQIYTRLEKYEEAVLYLERAISLAPDYFELKQHWYSAYIQLPEERIEGFVIIQVWDSNDRLIAFIKAEIIDMLNHTLAYEFLNTFNIKEVITREGQDFNVLEKRIEYPPLTEGFFGSVRLHNMFTTIKVPVLIAIHTHGFFVEEGDSLIVWFNV